MPRKVGVEVEFAGDTRTVIEGLREASLSDRASMHSYMGHSDEHWVVKLDGSVHDGGEMVSPPLDFDDPAQRDQITRAVQVLQDAGCRGSQDAGIHIHVDCSDLTPKQIVSVTKLFYKYEDVLYRVASSGWRTMRSSTSTYASPLDPESARAIAKATTLEQIMRVWYRSETGHLSELERHCRDHGNYFRYCGINLHSYFYRKTIEFRIFNSSVNPERVQAYVAMCVALVQDARNGKSRSINSGCWPMGTMLSEPERAAGMWHRFLQVLRYEAGMSLEDMSRLTKVWNDSVPQPAMRSRRASSY